MDLGLIKKKKWNSIVVRFSAYIQHVTQAQENVKPFLPTAA